jgi:hypothetical protein
VEILTLGELAALQISRNASMKDRRRECVVEAVPEDPSHPDGPTDFYLIFDGRCIAKRGKRWNFCMP